MRMIRGGIPSSFKISRSLRFDSASTTYLSRTMSAGNQQRFTISFWVKRSKITAGSVQTLFSAYTSNSDTGFFQIGFDTSDRLIVAGYTTTFRATSRRFRDPTAWYHIVVAIDTPNATANSRCLIYVNSSTTAESVFDTNNTITQNHNFAWGSAIAHNIGRADPVPGVGGYFDGYLTDILHIAGSVLTPSSFVSTNLTTGVAQPKAYNGSYGTNGFRLDFSDNSSVSSSTLGKDRVGSNDWTPSGQSVSLGAGNDSVTDSPSVYTDGKNGRGNYCTLNVIGYQTGLTYSEGGLTVAKSSSSATPSVYGTWAVSSGKWYWEVIWTAISGVAYTGATKIPNSQLHSGGRFSDNSGEGWAYKNSDGNKESGGSAAAYGNTYTTGDVIGVALDMDNGKIWFSKNGTWQASGDPAAGTNSAYTGLTGFVSPALSIGNASNSFTVGANFGQQAHDATNVFVYAPPSGFKALSAASFSTPSIQKPASRFDIATHTGSAGTQTISTSAYGGATIAFQVDAALIKSYSGASEAWILFDRNRSSNLGIDINTNAAEATITGFTLNSNGYGLPANTSRVSTTGIAYVGYMWSESQTSGFDLAHYTGDNTSNRLISHSLNAVPHFALVRNRSGGDIFAYHRDFTSAAHFIRFNDSGSGQSSTNSPWGTGSWTSSQFMVTNNATWNANAASNYAAYLWTEVSGYSRFGIYVGNGSSDGPVVWCGFRPKLIIIRGRDSAVGWRVYDSARDVANETLITLSVNSTSANSTDAAGIDLLSMGFKVRWSDSAINGSSSNYVFAAFAENPFIYSRGV